MQDRSLSCFLIPVNVNFFKHKSDSIETFWGSKFVNNLRIYFVAVNCAELS